MTRSTAPFPSPRNQPVAGLGERGDIVKVKRGYARHRLVPSGVGVRTDLARDMLTARAKMEAEDVLERADLQGLVQRLKASSVFEFASETSAKGGALLTPIQAADMVAAFSREFGAQLNGAKLSPAVLTSTGEHVVTMRLGRSGVPADVRVRVAGTQQAQ